MIEFVTCCTPSKPADGGGGGGLTTPSKRYECITLARFSRIANRRESGANKRPDYLGRASRLHYDSPRVKGFIDSTAKRLCARDVRG